MYQTWIVNNPFQGMTKMRKGLTCGPVVFSENVSAQYLFIAGVSFLQNVNLLI